MLAGEYPPWVGYSLRRLEQKGPPDAQETQKQDCTATTFSSAFPSLSACQLIP